MAGLVHSVSVLYSLLLRAATLRIASLRLALLFCLFYATGSASISGGVPHRATFVQHNPIPWMLAAQQVSVAGYVPGPARQAALALGASFDSRMDELAWYCRYYGLPKWVLRIAVVESGYGLNSPVALYLNNPFGMDYPRQRRTEALGRYGRFAVFASLEESVRDMKLWLDCAPQLEGESYQRYLYRRGFNRLGFYSRMISSVRLP